MRQQAVKLLCKITKSEEEANKLEETVFAQTERPYEDTIRRLLQGENLQTALLPAVLSKIIIPEGAEKCSKCKSRRITTFSLQMRSADEGKTVFYTCSQCTHVWRQ